MELRNVAVYALAGAALLYGAHLMRSEPEPPPQAPVRAGEALRVQTMDAESLQELVEQTGMPQPGTGYMGTGKSQLQFEHVPERNEEAGRVGEGRSDTQLEGDAREEDLKDILENLGGLPVYVEGVDGAAKSRLPKPKPGPRK